MGVGLIIVFDVAASSSSSGPKLKLIDGLVVVIGADRVIDVEVGARDAGGEDTLRRVDGACFMLGVPRSFRSEERFMLELRD